jgi:hypothetical protein
MTAQIIPLRKVTKPRAPRGPYRKPLPEQQKRCTDFYRLFGERLRHARAQLRLTEEEAAAAFYITLKTYRRHEAGLPSRSNVKGLRNFWNTYDVNPTWLLGGDGEPPRFRLRAV